jgi:hypothetical protein
MKTGAVLILTPLALLLVGCATEKTTLRTDAPDGLYCWTTNVAASYVLRSSVNDSSSRVCEITTFTPQRVVVGASSHDHEREVFPLEITGQAKEEMMTTWHDVLVIQNQNVYFGVAQRTGSSGSVVLLADTRKEADRIVSMLRRRYSLPP